MTPLVQARISWSIKLIGLLVAVGGVIGAAWVAFNATGIFTPVTIALFILLALVALITALQEFVKADPLTEIIPGDAGVQAQATVTATLDEVHQLLVEIKGVVTSLPQPQASVTVTTTTPPPATASDSTTITATAGDAMPPITVTPDPPVPTTPDTQEAGSAAFVPAAAVSDAVTAMPESITVNGQTYIRRTGVL